MNPSEALWVLSQRFLEQHPKEEQAEFLDEIAERITGQPGMDAPYPTTAKELANRVSDLLIASGKLELVQDWYRKMDKVDLSGETLESMAADLRTEGCVNLGGLVRAGLAYRGEDFAHHPSL